MNATNEFSFVLKPSAHGVGVFAAHDILKGSFMRVFGDVDPLRILNKSDVPEQFKGFCVDRGDTLLCPPDFGYMPIGWYLNHSSDANTEPRGEHTPEGGYYFFAKRDISAGEEITIDYNQLEESEDAKEAYYKK